jgi:hypothetical protein
MSLKRISLAASVLCLTCLALLGVAQARAEATAFTSLPATALQSKQIAVNVRTSAHAICALTVRYSDKSTQTLGHAMAVGGRAHWVWQVPEVAQPGRATVTAACGRAGSVSRAVTVVGSLIPPRIDVQKQGFSVRPRSSGSNASYGVLLKNVSPNADAVDVYVLVNFVMADGHLIGTSSNTIAVIGAGNVYAYGGSLSFPGAAPVDHLEISVKMGGRQRGVAKSPAIENVRVLPGRTDAAWMGEVDGEVVNDHPSLNLSRATLSAVVMDASGNVIGGGTGSASALLPPGTRQAFALRSGFDSIPWSRVASATVSSLATYTP